MGQQKNVSSFGLENSNLRVFSLIISVFLFLGAVAPGCPFFRSNKVPADGGVFRSDDAGLTWTQKANVKPPAGSAEGATASIALVNITSVAVDRNDDNIVYVGGDASGMFRSSDKGENWETYSGTGMYPNETIFDIVIDPKDSKNMYVAGASADAKGRLLKSEDGGQAWEQTYITLAAKDFVTKIEVDPYDPSVVYIITSKDGVFQSLNHGKSWTLLRRFQNGVNNIAINPKDTRILYVTSTQEGIFKSVDKGTSWASLTENLKSFNVYPGTEFTSIAIDPQNPSTVYLGYLGGMFRTDDGGQSWQKVNVLTPPALAPISSIAINEGNSKNIYYTINSQVFFTNSASASNWAVRSLPTARVLLDVTIDPKDSNVIYAGSKIKK